MAKHHGGLTVLPFRQSWSSGGDPVEKLKRREKREGLFIETPTMEAMINDDDTID